LSGESINQRSRDVGEWGFAKIPKSTKDRVKLFKFSFFICFKLDSFKEFGENDQIKDNRSCKKGVLADVIKDMGLLSSHEDFTAILVHSLFGISSIRYVLNDDFVVNFVRIRVQDLVGG
jgi:hypothetical protein